MRYACLCIALSLAGCASEHDQQLAAVKAANSTLAEWIWVEQRQAQGATPATYARSMGQQAAEQLTTAADELRSSRPDLARLIDGTLQGPPDMARLRAAAGALQQTEASLEAS